MDNDAMNEQKLGKCFRVSVHLEDIILPNDMIFPPLYRHYLHLLIWVLSYLIWTLSYLIWAFYMDTTFVFQPFRTIFEVKQQFSFLNFFITEMTNVRCIRAWFFVFLNYKMRNQNQLEINWILWVSEFSFFLIFRKYYSNWRRESPFIHPS